MADSSAVSFQTQTTASAKAAAAKVVAEDARINPVSAAVVDPAIPVHGASFTPKRGKRGTYQALGGEAQGLMAGLVVH